MPTVDRVFYKTSRLQVWLNIYTANTIQGHPPATLQGHPPVNTIHQGHPPANTIQGHPPDNTIQGHPPANTIHRT